jgi:death-on-curing protein
VIYLTYDEVLHVARRAIEGDVVVRDAGLLESASARPRSSVFGRDAYPDLETKAAALVHSLVNNHGLVDGNKRLGLACLIAFLGINGRRLTLSQDGAYDLIVAIADGSMFDVETIAQCLVRHTAERRVSRG